jgi:hypothetical protein
MPTCEIYICSAYEALYIPIVYEPIVYLFLQRMRFNPQRKDKNTPTPKQVFGHGALHKAGVGWNFQTGSVSETLYLTRSDMW